MIRYKGSGINHFLNIVKFDGSVFPWAFWITAPSALISGGLRIFIATYHLDKLSDENSILSDNAAWGGFSFLVGFLIVFRTNMAYSRFWDGCTAGYRMRAEWFDACSSLVAFCRGSQVEAPKIQRFKGVLVRLFSMMHAAALAEIEDDEEGNESCSAFEFELLDGAGIDEDSLQAILDTHYKVELIFHWIQELVVDSVFAGILAAPAPLLSRSFQELASGMVAFHEASQIAHIPFPFPYAQTCDLLLLLHWFIAPLVVSQWVTHPACAFLFTFIQVFVLWALNFIAVELENPFGTDANDLDGAYMQVMMNRQLGLLLNSSSNTPPRLANGVEWLPPSLLPLPRDSHNSEEKNGKVGPMQRQKSFNQVWASLPARKSTTARTSGVECLDDGSQSAEEGAFRPRRESVRESVSYMQLQPRQSSLSTRSRKLRSLKSSSSVGMVDFSSSWQSASSSSVPMRHPTKFATAPPSRGQGTSSEPLTSCPNSLGVIFSEDRTPAISASSVSSSRRTGSTDTEESNLMFASITPAHGFSSSVSNEILPVSPPGSTQLGHSLGSERHLAPAPAEEAAQRHEAGDLRPLSRNDGGYANTDELPESHEETMPSLATQTSSASRSPRMIE